ncbi:hypothetical protein LPJ64_006179 [Coemansia asiatica]|uniref:Uncharacterized protein n=1 Tax=Coemansia asiatica TaxID=1052880 RepID=A0A9W8CGY2_9FUNG|nr:hypothetical protein LPJ64_006179 [Coemansia asiatica]
MFKGTFSLALLLAIAAIGASAEPGHASVHRPDNALSNQSVAKLAASLKLITPMEIVTQYHSDNLLNHFDSHYYWINHQYQNYSGDFLDQFNSYHNQINNDHSYDHSYNLLYHFNSHYY